MRSLFLAVIVVGVLGVAGCFSAPRAVTKPSVVLTISTPDGVAPTGSQLVFIQRAMEQELARNGYVLARAAGAADFVAHVRFTPHSPTGDGRITIVSVDPNPARHQEAIAARDRFKDESQRTVREMVRPPPPSLE